MSIHKLKPIPNQIRNQTVYIGDSREDLDCIPSDSIQLIITSPPYWTIKDYNKSNQIGWKQSYHEYISDLNKVWLESYRVLEPSCRLIINVGDQFTRASTFGKYKIIPIHASIIESCEQIGFDYMGAIIWKKVTNTKTSGGANLMGSYPYPRNGMLSLDYEYILIFKKPGKKKKIAPNRLSLCKMSSDEWRRYFRGHWTFSGTRQEDHIAMFPEELPYRLMRMFSLKGDKILDPFLGSGTTLKVAEELDRIGFGMEFNSEFLPIIQKKVKSAKNSYNDFETIGKYLNDNCDYWKSEIYIDKQKRKGIYVMSFPKHNIAIDLINISKSTSDIEIIFRIERKLKERQISEILPDDKDISYYYIIVEGIQSSQLNSIINSLNIQDKVIICSYDQIITPDPDVSLIYQNSL